MPLFDEKELRDAETFLQKTYERPIYRAVRFRNALHSLLRDVDVARSAVPHVKLLAVDTIELVAATSYDESIFDSFTFGDLLADKPRQKRPVAPDLQLERVELETTDRLILQHLLLRRRDQYLLLDPYAEEVADVRDARERRSRRLKERLFNADFEKFSGFTERHLNNILDFIKSQAPADALQEWENFRNHFLPHWRSDFLDVLWNSAESLRSMDALIRDGRYLYVRDASFGDRSMLNAAWDLSADRQTTKPLFEWKHYEEFVRSPAINSEYEELHQIFQMLIGKAPRRYKKEKRLLDRAAERDARALATIHILNSFFHERQIAAGIELVTRSPTLHDIIGSLPEYRFGPLAERRLRIPLRHPFLLPDIYRFDAQSLATIGGVLVWLDGLLSPYLKTAELNVGKVNYHRDNSRMTDAKKAARKIIPMLRNILAIQEGLEQSSSTVMGEALAKTQSFVTKSEPTDKVLSLTNPIFIQKVTEVFRAITEQLRARADPFSLEATLALMEQNAALVKFEAGRIFENTDGMTFRSFDFRPGQQDADDGMPEGRLFGGGPCITMRSVETTEPTFNRLAIIHSKEMMDLLSSYARPAQRDHNDDSGEIQPTVLRVPVTTILKEVEKALGKLRDQDRKIGVKKNQRTETGALVYNLNAILLACIAFAAKRRYDTVISLSSRVLHQITQPIRWNTLRSTQSDDQDSAKLSLAFRELFLLRHYCERALAMDEYFGAGTDKISVTKNFARAQRDLDFAMLMFEDAQVQFRDYRLRLAHVGGWTDQYLLIADTAYKNEAPNSNWHEAELPALRRRIGIWAAASFAKEAIANADFAEAQRKSTKGRSKYYSSQRRYLAYTEARALQCALTIFLIFLAYRISPEMLGFWSIDDRPSRDRALAFRDWRRWWRRYKDLKKYKFSIRADALIAPVCRALNLIATLRRELRVKQNPKAMTRHSMAIKWLRRELEKMIAAHNSNQFLKAIAKAMIERLNEVRLRGEPLQKASNSKPGTRGRSLPRSATPIRIPPKA